MKLMSCIFTLLLSIGFSSAAAQGQTAPTGTIVFSSSGILALNVSDNSTRLLTLAGEAVSNPKISPDGCRVVFMVSIQGKGGKGGGIGIDIMNLDKNNPKRRRLISSGGGVPSWSTDNKTIAFGSNDAIWLLDTTEPPAGTPLPVPQFLVADGAWPVFSPSSLPNLPTRIAFSRQGSRDLDLWIMNLDNSAAQPLLPSAGADIDVGGWSQNGIVFAHNVSTASRQDHGGYEIHVLKPDEPVSAFNPVRLTNSQDNDYEPGWSPDRSMIVFASFRTPGGIYVMDLNGNNPFDGTNGPKRLTSGRQPSWGPNCPSVS